MCGVSLPASTSGLLRLYISAPLSVYVYPIKPVHRTSASPTVSNLYRSSSCESSFTLSHWHSMRTFHVPVEAPLLSAAVDGLAPVLHFRFPLPRVYQRGTWSLLDMASIRHDIFGFFSNHSPVFWLVHWVVFTSFPSRDQSSNGSPWS